MRLPSERQTKPGAECYVIGAGGHAKVVVATLRANGFRPTALFDDREEKHGRILDGVRVVGDVASLAAFPRRKTIVAIGDNRVRAALAQKYDVEWMTIVHPRGVVEEGALLGAGTIVMAGAVVQAGAHVGAHVIVNTCASVDHDCRVGDYCHIAPGAHLAGGVTLEEGVLMGIGSCAVALLTVGRWSTVGAGAALVRDLAPGTVAVGVPARPRGGIHQ